MTRATAGAPPEQHFDWMMENWRAYKIAIARFNDGLLRARVDFDALMDAYDQIGRVHLNAMDAGERPAEERAAAIQHDLRTLILRMINAGRVSCGTCQAWWNRYKGGCEDLGIEIDIDELRSTP